MLPQLYLIRHGETEWSRSGQYSGRADIPLTAYGEDEARAVGQRLRNIPFAHVLTLLNTASVRVLCYEHERTEQPAIALWNSVAPEFFVLATDAGISESSALKRWAIDRWENEGGEIPNVLTPQPAAMSAVRRPGKKLFVFDLDGTLAESKAALDPEMAARLKSLLGQVKVAVISGGDWPQFETQLLANLSPDANLKNLSLLPTCGTKFYHFESDWQQLYADDFTKAEKEKIIQSLEEAVATGDFAIHETWGEQIEDRGSQITFSALGQRAPLEQKEYERWPDGRGGCEDPRITFVKRLQRCVMTYTGHSPDGPRIALAVSEDYLRVILHRSVEPVLTPLLKEERDGAVPNVVFPTGIDRRDDLGQPDRIDLYYGMADSRIGVARLDMPEHLPPGAPADGKGPKGGVQE